MHTCHYLASITTPTHLGMGSANLPQLNSKGLFTLQKVTAFVALAALAGMGISILAGSFMAPVPLPLLELPNEFLTNLCRFLPLQDLGSLGQVNKKFATFLDSQTGQYTWKVIADELKIPLNLLSDITPKEQIKKFCLTIELPKCTVDLINHQLVMKDKVEIIGEFIKGVFTDYVPKGYYMLFNVGFGHDHLLYRDKNEEIQRIVTPGRGGKENWYPGELELFSSIQSENKLFKLIEHRKKAP